MHHSTVGERYPPSVSVTHVHQSQGTQPHAESAAHADTPAHADTNDASSASQSKQARPQVHLPTRLYYSHSSQRDHADRRLALLGR